MKFRNAILAAAMTMAAVSANAMLPTPNDAPQTTVAQQTAPNIDVKVNAYVVRTDETGKESLQLLKLGDGVSAGDIVEYQGLYTNFDNNRVRSMTVTLSIPEGAELIGQVEPHIVKASIDGNRFVNMPIRANVNGQAQELPLSYYKALRWTVEDVGIGATAVVKYRVRIK